MIKYLNKKLLNKITAFVVAGTLSCSGISAVHAEDDNVCYKEKKFVSMRLLVGSLRLLSIMMDHC